MEITVSNTDGLVSALSSTHSGDTIILTGTNYSAVSIQGVNFTGSGVTIKSADAAHPALVAGVELAGSSGLNFRNLEVTIDSRTLAAFNIAGSSNISLVGVNMHGVIGDQEPGLLFRDSTNVSVSSSQFHDLGTAVRNVNSSGITISDNQFHDLSGDGIQSNASSNVTIDGNYFTNFHTAPGDHPDAMQFFTLNQTSSAHDIQISNNVVVRGSGDIVQGIFLGNETNIPYENVEITGNKIIGEMFNGIAVGTATNVIIANNIVEAYTDQDSWLSVAGTSNATIQNNQAFSILDTDGNTGLTVSGNTTLAAGAVGDVGLLNAAPSAPQSTPAASSASGQILSGTASLHSLVGDAGDDTITGTAGSNTLFGGGGSDLIVGGPEFNRVNGNAGDDTIMGHSQSGDWLLGGQGADSIDASASAGHNVINGNLGNDSLTGGSGADTLRGGQGDDLLHADRGGAWISGDAGHNTEVGGTGADTFHGGAGQDLVVGFDAAGGDRVQLDPGVQHTIYQSNADVHIDFANGGEIVLQNVQLTALPDGWIVQQ